MKRKLLKTIFNNLNEGPYNILSFDFENKVMWYGQLLSNVVFLKGWNFLFCFQNCLKKYFVDCLIMVWIGF